VSRPAGSGHAALLIAACRRLIDTYDVDGWWPARTRFEVMVGAVLVQNTRWANVAAAIRALRGAGVLHPRGIATAESADLAALIRPAGCQSVKVRRLQALATWAGEVGNLRRLAAIDTVPLRRALLGVHGIGYETADAILCYAFDRQRFIADKYARTWLGRMGCVPPSVLRSYEACRRHVEAELQHQRVDLPALHAAIVLHGQAVCRPRPACTHCGLRDACVLRLESG